MFRSFSRKISSQDCNIIMIILQLWLLSWSFRGLFEVSWAVKYWYSHENIAIVEWELQYSHKNIAIYIASFGLWRLVGALLEPLWGYVAPVCSFLLQCLHIWINVANSWWHWNALPVPLPRQVFFRSRLGSENEVEKSVEQVVPKGPQVDPKSC